MIIEILVPAHDEEALIHSTLASIGEAIEDLKKHHPSWKVSVRVGADACTDQTAKIALGHTPHVTHYDFKSKWLTLSELIKTSKGDWVVICDSGVHWPKNLLTLFSHSLLDARTVGIAPLFLPSPHDLAARLQTKLRAWGNSSDVYGSCVAYQTMPLQKTFVELNSKRSIWINDDIVVPLWIRHLYPNQQIKYEAGTIQDPGMRKGGASLTRQLRALEGEVQWIVLLFPSIWAAGGPLAWLALKRSFQIFWGYLFVAVGVSLFFGVAAVFPGLLQLERAGVLLTPFALLVLASNRVRGFLWALWVSLIAPARVITFTVQDKTRVIWR